MNKKIVGFGHFRKIIRQAFFVILNLDETPAESIALRVRAIDLKIDNLDRVSVPTKIVATFDVEHPIHGTTYMASQLGVHSKLYACI